MPFVDLFRISYSLSTPSPLSELFATEHAHVRMLSVLQMIFSKPLEREELLTSTELSAIFPNLDEIIEMHCECCCKEAFFLTCVCILPESGTRTGKLVLSLHTTSKLHYAVNLNLYSEMNLGE